MTPEQLRECPIDQCAENTDREIYRGPDEGCGDYYSDSLHITEGGALGINCGGYVIVKPIRAWHGIAKAHADALEELAKAEGEGQVLQAFYNSAMDRAERAEAALAECRSKLEVDPRTKYDGIDCRDETIRILDERLAEAERKCERLRFHAEAMAKDLELSYEVGESSLAAYQAEFKEES